VDGEASKRKTIEAITRTVNPYGCLVFLTETLELDQRLALTNLATQTSNAAVVVWKGNQQPEGWEYGIELVATGHGILGDRTVTPPQKLNAAPPAAPRIM